MTPEAAIEMLTGSRPAPLNLDDPGIIAKIAEQKEIRRRHRTKDRNVWLMQLRRRNA